MKSLAILLLIALATIPAFAEPERPYATIAGIEVFDGLPMVKFKVCAGEYQILRPKIIVDTDEKPWEFTLSLAVAANKCHTSKELAIITDNPDTIKVTLVGTTEQQIDAQAKITDMQKEIDNLKKQIEAKDDIIKAQMQVIMDLANKIKSALFTQLNYFNSFF